MSTRFRRVFLEMFYHSFRSAFVRPDTDVGPKRSGLAPIHTKHALPNWDLVADQSMSYTQYSFMSCWIFLCELVSIKLEQEGTIFDLLPCAAFSVNMCRVSKMVHFEVRRFISSIKIIRAKWQAFHMAFFPLSRPLSTIVEQLRKCLGFIYWKKENVVIGHLCVCIHEKVQRCG